MTFWEYYLWRYAHDPWFRRITHSPDCPVQRKANTMCTCEYSYGQ